MNSQLNPQASRKILAGRISAVIAAGIAVLAPTSAAWSQCCGGGAGGTTGNKEHLWPVLDARMVAKRVQFKTQSGDKPFRLKIDDITTGTTLYEVNVPAGDGAAFGGSVPLSIGARVSLSAVTTGPSAGNGGAPSGRATSSFTTTSETDTDADRNSDCPEEEQDADCNCPDPDESEEEEEATGGGTIDNNIVPPVSPSIPTLPFTPPTGPGETPVTGDDDDDDDEDEEVIYPYEPTTPTPPPVPSIPPGSTSQNGGDQYGSQSSTDGSGVGTGGNVNNNGGVNGNVNLGGPGEHANQLGNGNLGLGPGDGNPTVIPSGGGGFLGGNPLSNQTLEQALAENFARADGSVDLLMQMGTGYDGGRAPVLRMNAPTVDGAGGHLMPGKLSSSLNRPTGQPITDSMNNPTGTLVGSFGSGHGALVKDMAGVIRQVWSKDGVAEVRPINGGDTFSSSGYEVKFYRTQALPQLGNNGRYQIPTTAQYVGSWKVQPPPAGSDSNIRITQIKPAANGLPETTKNFDFKRLNETVGNSVKKGWQVQSNGGTSTIVKTMTDHGGGNFSREIRRTKPGVGSLPMTTGTVYNYGPANVGKPTLPADTAIKKVVNVSAQGNKVTSIGHKGGWVQIEVTPDRSSPARRTITTKPMHGVNILPADVGQNSDLVERIESSHVPLPDGKMTTKTVTIGGKVVSRTITTRRLTGDSVLRPFVRLGDHMRTPLWVTTTVREAGMGSPEVSIVGEFPQSQSPTRAGKKAFEVRPDGTRISYAYDRVNFQADSAGDNSLARFRPFDRSPGTGAHRSVTAIRVEPGRVSKHVTVLVGDGWPTVQEEWLALPNASDGWGLDSTGWLLTSRRVNHYDHDGRIIKVEALKGAGYLTTYAAGYVGANKEWERDQDGLGTFYFYDGTGNLMHMIQQRADGQMLRTWLAYDQNSRVIAKFSGTYGIPSPIVRPPYPDVTPTYLGANGNPQPIWLGRQRWAYNSKGGVAEQAGNDERIDRYERQKNANGTSSVTLKVRPMTAPATAGSVESVTEYDAMGRIVSITGSRVAEEHHAYTVLGGIGQKHVITTGSGNAVVVRARFTNMLGQTVAETAQNGGSLRCYAYDGFGNRVFESLLPGSGADLNAMPNPFGGLPQRAWSYGPEGGVTVTTYGSPAIVNSGSNGLVQKDGGWWDSRTSSSGTTYRRLSGFGAANGDGMLISEQQSISSTGVVSGTVVRFQAPTASAFGTAKEIATAPGITMNPVRIYKGGELDTELTPDGSTTYRYDVLGRVRAISENSIGRLTQITYDGGSDRRTNVSVTTATGLSSLSSYSYYGESDSAPFALKSQTQNGLSTFYRYTTRGELRAVWGATYPVRYTYDLAGRLAKMETYQNEPAGSFDPNGDPSLWLAGSATQWFYVPGTGSLDHKADHAGKGASYLYDEYGRMRLRTWARGVSATYGYSGVGQLLSVNYGGTDPNHPAGAGISTTANVTLSYNARGQLASVTDGTGTRVYGYNGADRLETETLTTLGGQTEIFTYSLDTLGRRTGYVLASGNDIATWQGWTYRPEDGKVAGVQTPEGWISHEYNPRGAWPSRLVYPQTRPTTGGPVVQVASNRKYDDLGRLYDVKTHLEDGTLPNFPMANTQVSRVYDHDPATKLRNKLTEEDGDFWTYGYNDRAEVTSGVKKFGPGDALATTAVPGTAHSYTYDAIGNRVTSSTPTSQTSAATWTTNPLNQYTQRTATNAIAQVTGEAATNSTVSAVLGGGAPVTVERKRALFAASKVIGTAGPVAKWISVAITETKPGQAAVEQLGNLFSPPSPEGFAYDDDGNLLSDARFTYVWDAENRLIRVETRTGMPAGMPRFRVSYTYDAYWRQRSEKVELWNAAVNNGLWQPERETRKAWEGWNLVAEWNRSGASFPLAHTYHWSIDLSGSSQGAGGVGGLLLARHHEQSSSVKGNIPAYDGTGNIIRYVDSGNGKTVAEFEYGPFGETLRADGPMASANAFRWSTKQASAATGLTYYGYRWLSHVTGRWISRDPIEERGGRNLLNFLDNDSIQWVDWLGLELSIVVYSLDGYNAKDRADGEKKNEKFFKSISNALTALCSLAKIDSKGNVSVGKGVPGENEVTSCCCLRALTNSPWKNIIDEGQITTKTSAPPFKKGRESGPGVEMITSINLTIVFQIKVDGRLQDVPLQRTVAHEICGHMLYGNLGVHPPNGRQPDRTSDYAKSEYLANYIEDQIASEKGWPKVPVDAKDNKVKGH